jgi:hypothetical protein
VFALEPVWAALFGVTISGDRLGAAGWLGCAVIMAGIVLAEPAAAGTLVRLVPLSASSVWSRRMARRSWQGRRESR